MQRRSLQSPSIRAWMVNSWRPVEWLVPEDPDRWPAWHHVATVVDAHRQGMARGESVWACDVDGGRLGVAWEWIEWRPGVIVLLDPMSISSNLRAPDGCPSESGPFSRAIQLNRIAHQLPWCEQVIQALSAPPASQPSRPQVEALQPLHLAA